MKDRPLSTKIVKQVALKEGVDPAELSEPLYDTVDPDALDSLFADSTGYVVFEYEGYEITAESDGTVDVSPIIDT